MLRPIRLPAVAPVICLLLLSSLCFAERAFIIGVEQFDYKPLHWVEVGQYTGFNRDMLDAFAKSKGYSFTYKALPVKRLHKVFVRGDFDFKYPDDPAWSSNLKKGLDITYSDGVIGYTEGAMVKPQRVGAGIESISQLGTVEGFTPWAFWGSIESQQIHVNGVANFDALLKMTIKGRVHAAYISVDVANYHLKNSLRLPGALVFDPQLPHIQDAYHLSTIRYPQVIQMFNQFLSEESEQIFRLRNKYQLP